MKLGKAKGLILLYFLFAVDKRTKNLGSPPIAVIGRRCQRRGKYYKLDLRVEIIIALKFTEMILDLYWTRTFCCQIQAKVLNFVTLAFFGISCP